MGLPTSIYTGAQLFLKVYYPFDGTEQTIGYVTGLTYTVTQGQKAIFTVDSPFPQEIAQSASPSLVQGRLTMFLLRGHTPETLGLVPFRIDNAGENHMAASKYFHFKFFDRISNSCVITIEWIKIGQYTVNINARQIVRCELIFTGILSSPGAPTV